MYMGKYTHMPVPFVCILQSQSAENRELKSPVSHSGSGGKWICLARPCSENGMPRVTGEGFRQAQRTKKKKVYFSSYRRAPLGDYSMGQADTGGTPLVGS